MSKGFDIKMAVNGTEDVAAAVKKTTKAMDDAGKAIQAHNLIVKEQAVLLKAEAGLVQQVAAAKKAASADERRENETILEYRKRLLQLSDLDRKAAFARLAPEEQINRLYARREQAKAQAAGTSRETERLRMLVREKELTQQLAGLTERRIADAKKLQTAWQSQVAAQLRANQSSGVAQASGGVAGILGGVASRALVGAAGLFTAGAALHKFSGFGESLMDHADRIGDLSDRYGVSTDRIQAWMIAAEKSGTSVEALGNAYKRLKLAVAAAVKDNKDMQDALGGLGQSMDEVKRSKLDDTFDKISEHVHKAPPDLKLFDSAMKALGKTAELVLPAMRDGLKQVGEQAEKMGAIIPPELIRQLSAEKDKQDAIRRIREVTFAPEATALARARTQTQGSALQFGDLLGMLTSGMSGNTPAAIERGLKMKDRADRLAEMNRMLDEASKAPKPEPLPSPDDSDLFEKPKPDKHSKRTRVIGEMLRGSQIGTYSAQADQLARIGLFVGSAGRGVQDRQVALMQTQVNRLDRIVSEMVQMNQEMRRE